MTRDEKIQQEMASKTREEKLEKFRDSLHTWDHDSLVEAAFAHIEISLDNMTSEEFDDEYYDWFLNEFKEPEYDDDEKEIKLMDKCSCDIHQLMRGEGHDELCQER